MSQNMWIFIALISFALYAATNILDKIFREKYVQSNLALTIISIGRNIPMALFIPFVDLGSMRPVDYALVMVVGALSCIMAFTYFSALSLEEVSRVVPFWNIAPIFVVGLSTVFLNERLTGAQFMAVALLLTGGILISTHLAGLTKMRLSKAFWLMLISVIMFSCSVIILKYLLGMHPFWSILVLTSSACVLMMLPILFFKQARSETMAGLAAIKTGALQLFIGGTVVWYAAFLLYYYAISKGPVSIIVSMDGFQSIFLFFYVIVPSLLFPHIFREEITKSSIIQKIIAIGLMCAGLFLLYL